MDRHVVVGCVSFSDWLGECDALEFNFGSAEACNGTVKGWSRIDGFTMTADQSFTAHPYMFG